MSSDRLSAVLHTWKLIHLSVSQQGLKQSLGSLHVLFITPITTIPLPPTLPVAYGKEIILIQIKSSSTYPLSKCWACYVITCVCASVLDRKDQDTEGVFWFCILNKQLLLHSSYIFDQSSQIYQHGLNPRLNCDWPVGENHTFYSNDLFIYESQFMKDALNSWVQQSYWARFI